MKNWKNIAILTPIIIIAGLLKQIIYYAFFNIPIVQFIDLNEIIVLFSEDILHIIGLFFILGFISYIGSNTKTKIKFRRFQSNYYNEDEVVIRIWKYISENYVNILFLIILASLIWSNVIKKEESEVTMILLVSIDTIFFILRFAILEIKRNLYNKGRLLLKNKKYESLLSISILAINLILIFSVNEFDRVKYEGKYSNVTILLNDEIIESDSCSFFIGKTRSYIFFHSVQNNMTRAIPSNRVREIQFGRSEKKFWETENLESKSDSTATEQQIIPNCKTE